MKILLVAKIDPWSSIPCGIRGYSLGLLAPFLKKKMEVTIIGCSTTTNDSKDAKFSFINVLEGQENLLNLEVFFDIALYIKFFSLMFRGFFSEFDIIHVQRIDQALPFLLLNKSVICTLHGKASDQARDKHGIIAYVIVRIIERIAINRLDHTIAVSNDIKNFYIKKFPHVSKKINVIPNGVDTNVFRPMNRHIARKNFGFDPDENIVLYIGRFHPEKNLKLLITSFYRLIHIHNHPTRLILVGEGKTKGEILDLVRQKNLEEYISIFKPVPDVDVPKIISCADVYGLSSYVEGFPLVILQALACGIPVVSTNVGEVSRVIKDNFTGFIVNDFSCETFADRLNSVLLFPDQFKDNCVATAQNFTWDCVADNTIEIYNDTLTKRSSK